MFTKYHLSTGDAVGIKNEAKFISLQDDVNQRREFVKNRSCLMTLLLTEEEERYIQTLVASSPFQYI